MKIVNLLFVGSGRWCLNYINSVLQINNNKNLFKIYVSKTTKNSHDLWALEKNKFAGKIFFINILETINYNINFAVVCNAANQHVKYSAFFLHHKIPVLLEKPYAFSSNSMNFLFRLSLKNQTKLFLSDLFRFNESFNTIKMNLTKPDLKMIKIYWTDINQSLPFNKFHTIYDPRVTLYQDIFPHIFNILRSGLDVSDMKLIKTKFMNYGSFVVIFASIGNIAIRLFFSRDYLTRQRSIKFISNNNDKLIIKNFDKYNLTKNKISPMSSQILNSINSNLFQNNIIIDQIKCLSICDEINLFYRVFKNNLIVSKHNKFFKYYMYEKLLQSGSLKFESKEAIDNYILSNTP